MVSELLLLSEHWWSWIIHRIKESLLIHRFTGVCCWKIHRIKESATGSQIHRSSVGKILSFSNYSKLIPSSELVVALQLNQFSVLRWQLMVRMQIWLKTGQVHIIFHKSVLARVKVSIIIILCFLILLMLVVWVLFHFS